MIGRTAILVSVLLVTLTSLVSAREWKDASGKFSVEAELVAVRNGKVILEKPNGALLSVPLDKLSKADRDFLAGKPAAPPTPVVPAEEQKKLAGRAHEILKNNCYRCHGEDGTNEGGFNFVLDLKKLTRGYVTPGDPDDSYLFERLTDPDEDSRMPPPGEERIPSKSEVAVVKQWIEAGAPPIAQQVKREFISPDEIVAHILSDLRNTSQRSRRFNRYFTLTHLYNSGVSEDELQTYRLAFAKMINSLSWNANLAIPTPIDPAKTVLRIDIRDVNWNADIWDQIMRANPYHIRRTSKDAVECYKQTECDMPWIRVDWFVNAASQPPLYHTILNIPKTDRQLEEALRVDVKANIEQEKVVRAGFNRSGVSQNNRLIERHALPVGSYWKSYDFASNTGRQNLFSYPLGPDGGRDTFQHDGGEIIFTLPNGLQGYMLTDAKGNRIDRGPTSIVSDPERPDRAVVNGISCMSCHYAGLIAKADEIRPHVKANLDAYDDSETILALYPEPRWINSYFETEGGRFVNAMKRLGIKKVSKTGEPISTMALRFQTELDATQAAAEFGLTTKELETKLEETPSVARLIGSLKVSGGTIKRDLFVEVFATITVDFNLIAGDEQDGVGGRPTGNRPVRVARIPGRMAAIDAKPDPNDRIHRIGDLGWAIKSVTFSPDGGLVAAGKMDDKILVFNTNTGKRLDLREKLNILGQVTQVAFTPDGEKLLAGGYSGTILIWDVSPEGKLKPSGQFAGHSGEITTMTVSSDGRFVLSGGRDRDKKKMRYWEIESGRQVAAFEGLDREPQACFLSDDGREGLATDGRTLLRLGLGMDGVVKKTIKLANGSGQCSAFSPDGTKLVANDSYALKVFNTTTGQQTAILQDREIQWSATFSPDGRYVLSGGRGKINLWEIDSGSKRRVFDTGTIFYVQTMAFSPDNLHFAAYPSAAGQELQVFRVPDLD